MKRFQSFGLGLLVIVLVSGCATIIKGQWQDVDINSTPSGATLQIFDRNDELVYEGQTPATVELKRGDGYFRGQRYRVEISGEGGQNRTVQIENSVNGWYIAGNVLLGGLIGWVVVDPITGGMFNLRPKNIDTQLAAAPSSGDATIHVVLIDDLSDETLSQHDLVPIN